MSRTIKKAVFLQNNKYVLPENRLAEYHGAIFAEEFQKMRVSATKMVLGDPNKDKPISELLSVSSMEQRLSPIWWKEQDYDLIVFYCGPNIKNIPVVEAIKRGSPKSVLILKMDAAYGPFIPNFKSFSKTISILYTKDRHGHVTQDGHGSAPALIALARALYRTIKYYLPAYQKQLIRLFELPNFVSYENTSALIEAKKWLESSGRPELEKKVIWLGYPVREIFDTLNSYSIQRKSGAIISVANWKHAKDLNLHARAMAEIFKRNDKATFKIIGANSVDLYKKIIQLMAEAENRIERIDEVSNKDLPRHLQEAQVFMLCSFTEGICSAVLEALCSGCSAALSCGVGVPCFTEFVAEQCGTQAISRNPRDMANAVLNELELWQRGIRDSTHISETWSKTLVSNLNRHLCNTINL